MLAILLILAEEQHQPLGALLTAYPQHSRAEFLRPPHQDPKASATQTFRTKLAAILLNS